MTDFVIPEYVIPKKLYFVVLPHGTIENEPLRTEMINAPHHVGACMFTEELHAERACEWWDKPDAIWIEREDPLELITLLETYRDKLGLHYVTIDAFTEEGRNAHWYQIDRLIGVLLADAEGDS